MGVFGGARCFASIAEILSFNCTTRDLRYSSSSDTPMAIEKSGRRGGELNGIYSYKSNARPCLRLNRSLSDFASGLQVGRRLLYHPLDKKERFHMYYLIICSSLTRAMQTNLKSRTFLCRGAGTIGMPIITDT